VRRPNGLEQRHHAHTHEEKTSVSQEPTDAVRTVPERLA
jgi:hypothetical protein